MIIRLAYLFKLIRDLQRVVRNHDWNEMDQAHKRLFDAMAGLRRDYVEARIVPKTHRVVKG